MWDKCDKARNKQLKIILFQRPKEKKIGQRKIDCWWKGKETFSLLAKLLHASMHTWPGQSDPRTNCQYGNNLVKQLTRWKGLHINTHTSSRWVNIFFQSRSKLYPGKHKSVTPWKSPKCRSGIFGRKTKMQQLTNENQCIRQQIQITNPAPLPW